MPWDSLSSRTVVRLIAEKRPDEFFINNYYSPRKQHLYHFLWILKRFQSTNIFIGPSFQQSMSLFHKVSSKFIAVFIIFFQLKTIVSYFGPAPTKGIQTPHLSFDPTFMKDVQCAESNEKIIFRFLFSELSEKFFENWSSLKQKWPKNAHNTKDENRKNRKKNSTQSKQ